MPPVISTASDPGPRNSSCQGARCTPIVCSPPTILRENTLGGSGCPSAILTSGLVARQSMPRKRTIHIQTSMPSVSVTNHFTGWGTN
ncbi:hypothetical protein TNCV_1947161 [Trichonephila clavipes]|nr:hypothetical protein TNCV_1947161 [Trichonephila clavipes]